VFFAVETVKVLGELTGSAEKLGMRPHFCFPASGVAMGLLARK